MGNTIDLKNIDGPVVDDLSADYIELDMMEQSNVVNAMMQAFEAMDMPNGSLAAYEHDGRVILRNEINSYEDGGGTATLADGTEIQNASIHVIGASAFISELENGNYSVQMSVQHAGSFEQGIDDYRRVNINYEVDAEDGSIVSRQGHAVGHDDAPNIWAIETAQAIEHAFAENLGPTAQETLADFRPNSAATESGPPPIGTELNSLSEIVNGTVAPDVQQKIDPVIPLGQP